MLDEGDVVTPYTSLSIQIETIIITIETSAHWTPEMIEDALGRCSRQMLTNVMTLTELKQRQPKGDEQQ